MPSDTNVVVIGAGPYGLGSAAHLRKAGVDTRVFGDPMSFWQDHMPAGMLLRSPWKASHLSDPDEALTLDAFRRATGRHFEAPVPLDQFIAYGRWFQQQAVPHLERRRVEQVDRNGNGFYVDLEGGERIHARHVVVATGLDSYANCPGVFSDLPPELVSHSSDIADFAGFAGQRVVVIGAGQSALESAALLHEAGADVSVLARSSTVHWLVRSSRLHRLGPVTRLLYAPTDVCPAVISQLAAAPNWFRLLPRSAQDPLGRRCIRPAGAAWLRSRTRGVTISLGTEVQRASAAGDSIRLTLNDGSYVGADHVLCATGYRVDVSKFSSLLAPSLIKRLDLANGYPKLKAGLESSVPGLHFVGAPAAYSFGPLMRFVAGSPFAARALTKRVARSRGR